MQTSRKNKPKKSSKPKKKSSRLKKFCKLKKSDKFRKSSKLSQLSSLCLFKLKTEKLKPTWKIYLALKIITTKEWN